MVPLTGFRGEVKEVDEQTSIAKVAVQVYGRVASMDWALEQIEQVPKIQTETLPLGGCCPGLPMHDSRGVGANSCRASS